MDRVISLKAAIDALIKYNTPRDNGDGTITLGLLSASSIEKVLNELPSAQPDIIRCRECKFNTYSKKCLNPDSFFLVPADDFYCGYAERRTDE